MQHCSISVTLWLTYTDDRCVKKLVRPWQFTAAICFYILLAQLTEPPQFQERARLNALKCLPNCRQQRKLPQLHASGKYAGGSRVKVHRPMTHMTHPKNWPISPMTHRPIVYSSVVSVRPTVSISAHKPTDLGLRYFACVLVMVVDRLGLIVEVIGQG